MTRTDTVEAPMSLGPVALRMVEHGQRVVTRIEPPHGW